MKGLTHIPSIQDFLKAYEHLELDLPLYSQWCRFNPRFAEVWVVKLSQVWKSLNPVEFNQNLRKQPWPEAVGPLIESVPALLSKQDRDSFQAWAQAALYKVKPGAHCFYFIGEYSFSPKRLEAKAMKSHRSFLKWGYFGDDILLNKGREKLKNETLKSELSSQVRQTILNDLLKTKDRITVLDYLEALDFRIQRRLAQLDLSQDSRLKAVGSTRARFFVVKG